MAMECPNCRKLMSKQPRCPYCRYPVAGIASVPLRERVANDPELRALLLAWLRVSIYVPLAIIVAGITCVVLITRL